MRSRWANVLTFLTAFAAQAAVVWQDPQAGLSDKLAATLVACLGLALSRSRLMQVEQNIIAAATVVGTVLTVALTHLSAGSKAAAVCSVALATVTSARMLLLRGVAPTTSVLLLALGLSSTSCRGVKPDQFLDAVVDCARINPEGSAALAQVETCLISAVSGNPSACLGGLVTVLHFTVDEVACVVAYVAQKENVKVAASTATDKEIAVRDAAAKWLSQERIAIRNTYQAK